MVTAALKLSNISKHYPGVRALNSVDFECLQGEVHAVVGENGSGKSTLLGIASGAIVADDGRIEIMGEQLVAADPSLARRQGLSTVYQDDSLIREFTVAENLQLAAADTPPALARTWGWAEQQLTRLGLDFAPEAMVGDLSPSQRQFLEIAKALVSNPKVLLLDEPTSTLDRSGVEQLTGIVRGLTAQGVGVVYVSHRLPEVLSLADRVTILRDGVGQGTYKVGADLSERDLIALMVGRPVETGLPQRPELADARVMFWASGLSGARFHDVGLHLHRGEILGFAGAEGNGQRDVLRALGGAEPASGHMTCEGKPVNIASTREALEAGLVMLSADRVAESVFPALGVRENMTLQVLETFARGGFVSGERERQSAGDLAATLKIVAPSLERPVSTLSGGNQQKTVLGRSFLYGARVLLIDEPTQGVDANARFDIYRAIRARVGEGTGCIVNSSDALELASICDRVLVFSRGRIVRVLAGTAVTEEAIVASFLASKDATQAAAPDAATAGATPSLWSRFQAARARGSWWVPLLVLALLTVAVGAYAASQSTAFLTPLNIRHILLATAPLALVTMAQFNVLMVRGFDVSVGSLMSLTVVTASFVIAIGTGAPGVVLGVGLCLIVGLASGAANGALVRGAGVNPVISTIATLSVLQGIALYYRPSPAGMISQEFLGILTTRFYFIPVSFFAILALAVVGDTWLYRSRSGLALRATGFREEAAKRNGVRINMVHVRAYLLSGLLAAVAGLFLSAEVGVGTPTIGADYTLKCIAAAVLGGAALTGGRGSFLGAMLGALFFTLTINVVSLLGLNTAVGVMAGGVLTLLAVLLYSGWETFGRIGHWIRATFGVTGRKVRAMNDWTLERWRTLVPLRFAAIWIALVALVLIAAIFDSRSLVPSTVFAIIPFAAFLAIATMGETIVLMSRGIDLSVPAVITLASAVLLGASGGSDAGLVTGVVAALVLATAVGFANGVLVGVFKLNALIVTLAVGAITTGATLWYRQYLPAESGVPPVLADWGSSRLLDLNVSVWVAALLVVVLTIVLRQTVIGRRFSAVGTNPRAASMAGINLPLYQVSAFALAGFLYGVAGILLSAFIRTPTFDVGNPYLLAPIAAAVLGGTAITGGIGSMIAVAGAALFLTQLGQMLKIQGYSTAIQLVIQGLAIALGMALAESRFSRLRSMLGARYGRGRPVE